MMAKQKKSTSVLYVKNMVCNRCIKVVKEEMEKLGLRAERVDLGEVELLHNKKLDLAKIRATLLENGFELIEDRRMKIIEHIKRVILELARHDHATSPLKINSSEYIAREVGQDYHSLSSLFSSVENITIEQYIILQKIERAKELLKYGELTLSEIAYTMGYSSVQHLSNQFKNVTGLTPSHFKGSKKTSRNPLDRVGNI